ncbi:MAG: Aspartyl/glutamyl-tRNA amidotransferase subunit C [uncultured bacterium]|uniref:Aspartyl/glutamyl-tRNA(Asn/Gln) amidotransferase subunit C n=2 Tax=Candidatus Wolfeibacteriota TaxID=1752735 RepID=A0A0G1H8U2_9BACT|nr:MAG: Aspartyl/glutamyl-tRNA amidotransferase subunit C [uncultured bacterium]KKR12298.1 MAG: Aspartyl/glutamyl-tRNA(Asn/Gln) amidotransferase subunit C [Candidatus Wolfebacteria bacterium GW2011_GWC2_39_22]KKT43205.1 MAG: Aspartyl/glutamyl-tRNA(Asn/Gln) amidotransferase subunit C [Candidatus Wolfebacteria bacterium GW2011_GWE2_44_13]HBI25929.1 Asp-tRNA(Asn)/Glu-tRNA(Gln) amidotransferase subunit GatB [Candidatus Wolfebacteria bacterium]
MTHITEETLEYLAKLARMDLADSEKAKLAGDLEEILNHFEELNEVDTTNVEPMTGGTAQRNVFREDEAETRKEMNGSADDIIAAFPSHERGYLKVPAVFGEQE